MEIVAILVAAGSYHESRVQMKPHVDLYGGFAAGDWKSRDIYQNATILDGQKKGPVVLGADNARLDGFVITGGQQNGHGGGIVCDGVSPTIVNNIIVGNNTLRAKIGEGLGKQIGHEGARDPPTALRRDMVGLLGIAHQRGERDRDLGEPAAQPSASPRAA